MLKQAVVYITQSQPFILSDEKQRLYRKELIHVGDFVKRDKRGEQRFSVDEVLLNHWQRTHRELVANGIQVPLPLDHSESVEHNRGEIVDMEVGVNDSGMPALFGIVKFRDAEAEKMASTANVSIYVPPEFIDGKNRKYVRPIRHVALTDYPVIPGLGKFQAIAASFEGDLPVEQLRALAKKLGVPDDTPDDKLLAAIDAKVSELQAAAGDSDTDTGDDDDDDDDEGGESGGGANGQGPVKKVVKEFHPPVAASFINIARRDRTSRLDTLVREGRITTAVRKELAKKYCTDSQVKLVLSHKDPDPDGFEGVIAALSLNEPHKHLRAEASGAQVPEDMVLAHTDVSPQKNSLMRDVERRLKERDDRRQ